MAVVIVKGGYLGANIRESEYDGKKKSALYIDVYQKDSPSADKAVSLKSDDLTLSNKLTNFKMGQEIVAECQVNAYRNQAYFKVLRLV